VIVLDTNVLSELMRSDPAAAVFAWVSVQPRATLYTTNVSKAEILYGIAVLPERRAAAGAMFADDFEGRVLPFDEAAAVHYAEIVAATARRRFGLAPATPGISRAAALP
jgi:predicted nucleic acid-binding protein